jgi:hypothetical protein
VKSIPLILEIGKNKFIAMIAVRLEANRESQAPLAMLLRHCPKKPRVGAISRIAADRLVAIHAFQVTDPII